MPAIQQCAWPAFSQSGPILVPDVVDTICNNLQDPLLAAGPLMPAHCWIVYSVSVHVRVCVGLSNHIYMVLESLYGG